MPKYFESGSIDNFGGGWRKDVKQVLYSAPQPMQAILNTYSTEAEITGKKASPGAMAFCTGNNRIYIYNGTAWVKSAVLS